jgi:hypothetical protein
LKQRGGFPGWTGGAAWGKQFSMSTPLGQGSAGNVIASLASFFIPGLGQLIQGRLLPAILFFVFTGILWVFFLGWIIHLWACLDAALWKPQT